jgi:hypothetical protein
MLPEIDQSRLDPRAEARFKTLQQAVRTLNLYFNIDFCCKPPFASLTLLISSLLSSFLSFSSRSFFFLSFLCLSSPTVFYPTHSPHLLSSTPLHSTPHLTSPFNPQVTLVRVARERRHIRNNLPLRGVLVIAANKDDIEALEYLKGELCVVGRGVILYIML